MGRLFGTDGVRGVANADLTAELAFRLGRAGAAVLASAGRGGEARPLVVVGRDPRRSGDMLEAALVAGLLSAGADVLRVGVVTTPAIAFLVQEAGAAAGVMISASHNPAEYNGIKFFSGDGFKLPDILEDRIEALLEDPGAAPRPTGGGVGRCSDDPARISRYVERVAASARHDFSGLSIVVDCANGSASAIAPAVYRRRGAAVIAIHDRPDGLNINEDCGSTRPERLVEAVRATGAHLGVAHDGDADRAIFVHERGGIVDGDHVLAICGLARLAAGTLPGGVVVGTVLSNMGLELALRAAGGRLERAPVGDRYVLEAMRRGGFTLGGEQSGHIIFADLSTTGDGILTACQVMDRLVETGRPLSELAAAMRRLPQVQRSVRVADRSRLGSSDAIRSAVAAAEAELGGRGRVLVRSSGTEPVVRVMVEGPEQSAIEAIAGRLAAVIERELGA